jgi:hypothetical protein
MLNQIPLQPINYVWNNAFIEYLSIRFVVSCGKLARMNEIATTDVDYDGGSRFWSLTTPEIYGHVSC